MEEQNYCTVQNHHEEIDGLSDMNWLTILQPTTLKKYSKGNDRHGNIVGPSKGIMYHLNDNGFGGHHQPHQNSILRPPANESAPAEEIVVMNRRYVKPSFSYAKLITMAIDSSTDKKLLLKDIYEWIETRYPFYKYTSNKGWKNSIRHNLSLKPYFIKLDRNGQRCNATESKGCYWMLAPSMQKENIPPGQHVITTTNNLTNIYTQPKSNIPTNIINNDGKNVTLIATPLYTINNGDNIDNNSRRVVPILPKGVPAYYVLTSVASSSPQTGNLLKDRTNIIPEPQHNVINRDDHDIVVSNPQNTFELQQTDLTNEAYIDSSASITSGICSSTNAERNDKNTEVKAWDNRFSQRKRDNEDFEENLNIKKYCDSSISDGYACNNPYKTPTKKEKVSISVDEHINRTPVKNSLQDVFPENLISSPLDTLSTPKVNALLKNVNSSSRKNLDKYEVASFWSEMEAVAGMATLFTTPVSSKGRTDNETTSSINRQPTLAALNDKIKATPLKNANSRVNFDDLSLTPYLKTVLNSSYTSDSGVFSFSSPTRSPKSLDSMSALSPMGSLRDLGLPGFTPMKVTTGRTRRNRTDINAGKGDRYIFSPEN